MSVDPLRFGVATNYKAIGLIDINCTAVAEAPRFEVDHIGHKNPFDACLALEKQTLTPIWPLRRFGAECHHEGYDLRVSHTFEGSGQYKAFRNSEPLMRGGDRATFPSLVAAQDAALDHLHCEAVAKRTGRAFELHWRSPPDNEDFGVAWVADIDLTGNVNALTLDRPVTNAARAAIMRRAHLASWRHQIATTLVALVSAAPDQQAELARRLYTLHRAERGLDFRKTAIEFGAVIIEIGNSTSPVRFAGIFNEGDGESFWMPQPCEAVKGIILHALGVYVTTIEALKGAGSI